MPGSSRVPLPRHACAMLPDVSMTNSTRLPRTGMPKKSLPVVVLPGAASCSSSLIGASSNPARADSHHDRHSVG